MPLKKNTKIKKEIENSLVRKIQKQTTPFIKRIFGNYYKLLHVIIMLSSGTVLLFNNNIYHLLVLLNIICLDAIACVFLHDCPLTILEQQYLGHNIIIEKTRHLKEANILYKCDHHYEKTLEFLTNMVCFVFGKILFLILMEMFQIKCKQDS